MDAIVAWLLDGLIKGSLVVLVAALVAGRLRRRSAATRHAVWAVALLAQVVVPMLSFAPRGWTLSLLPPIPVPRAPAVSRAETRPGSHGARVAPAAAGRPAPNETAALPSLGAALPKGGPSLPVVVVALWLAGAAAVLARLAVGTYAVARLARKARPVGDEQWLSLLRDVVAALGVRRPVALLRCDRLGIPAMRGVLRPIVLLPRGAEGWSLERRRLVLVHEVAHVKRCDAVTQFAGQVVLAVFWMNPLVWYAARQARLERERACDDYVLRGGVAASAYAHELLEMVHALVASTGSAFVTLMLAQRPSEFECRIAAILHPHMSRRPLDRDGMIVAAGLAALLVLPLAMLRLVALEPLQLLTAPLADTGADIPPAISLRDTAGRRPSSIGAGVERPLPRRVKQRRARCLNGHADGFRCRGIELLAFLPRRAIGGGTEGAIVNSIWGWIDSSSGREFAVVGRSDGTAFVEVTDPASLRYLGELPLHDGAKPSPFRDVKVYRHHAFIGADAAGAHGIQIFDLTQLRNIKNAPVVFGETAHYDRVNSVHSLVMNEASGYLYAAGSNGGGENCGSGLHMIDVHDPAHPIFAGCYTEPATGGITGPGYVHDAQCVMYRGPDARYRDREICLNSSGGALGIADVTDKQHPKTVGIARYPNIGYTHQGWLSEDQRYFFQGDELDDGAGGVHKTRTIVFDLANLDDPVVATQYYGTTSASDHNLIVRGRYMYQSNYSAGLRVADVTDPTHPEEVGYFDTFPDGGADAPGFAGTWGNYPYFRNGVVGVTSMSEGLFLVRVTNVTAHRR